MGKEQEIKKVHSMVKDILIKSVKARNSDAYLYCKVLEKIGKGLSQMPFDTIIMDSELPKYDTVTRARRKIQEKNPELQGDERVTKCRKENEEVFKEYSRS